MDWWLFLIYFLFLLFSSMVVLLKIFFGTAFQVVVPCRIKFKKCPLKFLQFYYLTICASSWATTNAIHCLFVSEDTPSLYRSAVSLYVMIPQFSIAPELKSGKAIISEKHIFECTIIVDPRVLSTSLIRLSPSIWLLPTLPVLTTPNPLSVLSPCLHPL